MKLLVKVVEESFRLRRNDIIVHTVISIIMSAAVVLMQKQNAVSAVFR